MIRKNPILYLFCLIFLLAVKIVGAEEKNICLNHHKELLRIKKLAVDAGGIWFVYEKTDAIRSNSFEGLNLDGKINQIVEISKYLCQTMNGVPLKGLAIYVLSHIEKMGENAFREQLINIRGKSEKDIEIWFNYAKVAIDLRERKLSFESVIKTLNRANEIVLQYWRLVRNQNNFVYPENFRKETGVLLKQIEKFYKLDSNMSLAIKERKEEPYWDIYEGDVG